MVHRIHVTGRVIKVRRGGADELGTRLPEELLEELQTLGPTPLQLHQLIAVLLPQSRVDGIIQLRRAECDANGDERVHLIVLLAHTIELAALVLLEILRAADVDEDVGEHADGVGVPPHHHVAEANVVVRGEMRSHHAGEHGFLVQLDVVEGLEGEREVAQ